MQNFFLIQKDKSAAMDNNHVDTRTLLTIGAVAFGVWWFLNGGSERYSAFVSSTFGAPHPSQPFTPVSYSPVAAAPEGSVPVPPTPKPLDEIRGNFLRASQVTGAGADTVSSTRKGAMYGDLRPPIPVQKGTTWMNQSPIDGNERVASINAQRVAFGMAPIDVAK